MQEIGYVYHRNAANLRSGKTSVVGALVTDISNPSIARLVLDLEEGLAREGLFTMVTNSFDEAERELAAVRRYFEHPVDALVYVPATTSDSRIVKLFASTSVPLLAVTRPPADGMAYVGADNIVGGEIAAEHLISVHGCRRLIYVGGSRAGAARRERIAGVERAIAASAGAELVDDLEGETSVRGSMAMAARVLGRETDFDAVLCHSDIAAYALLHEWSRQGTNASAVIGFDDLPISAIYRPTVTSVGAHGVGRVAAEAVLQMLQGGEAKVRRIAPELTVRASCGCNASDSPRLT